MNPTDVRLVLAPGLGYDDVARALSDWDGGPTDHHPWLGGEPVSARWTRGQHEVRYSANPAIGLRVVEGSGLDGIALPSMAAADALRLAGSAVEQEALLGATALELLTPAARARRGPGRSGADRRPSRRARRPRPGVRAAR